MCVFKEGGIGVKGVGGQILYTPALQHPVTNHRASNQIIPRQRAFSAHMCSHKEPRKLQAWRSFHAQARQDPLRPLTAVAEAAVKTEGRGERREERGRGGVGVILTPLRFFHWWEVCITSSLSLILHEPEMYVYFKYQI